MGNLKKSPGFDRNTEAKLKRVSKGMADEITAEFMKTLMDEMPVEDGHAHESFISAVTRYGRNLPLTVQAALGGHAKASGDPIARSKGRTEYRANQSEISVKIATHLPFVRKLEYGERIDVGDLSGNQGWKFTDEAGRPLVPPGTLYGPRQSGAGGMLVWREGGVVHKAPFRIPTGSSTGFFAKAVAAARRHADHLAGLRS